MEAHTLTEAQACELLASFNLVDPLGQQTLAEAVSGCWCVRLVLDRGYAVVCMKARAGRLWISAAGGSSRESITAESLAWIMDKARQWGACGVGFQTVRRGLVRRACALGYVARSCGSGWVLEKNTNETV